MAAVPADSYALLRAAIEDPNPVVFVENKALYGTKGKVPEDLAAHRVEIGRARIARPGRDVTLVTYGAMLYRSLEAAESASALGIEVEVLDLRTLQPWDEATVLDSLARTHRVVIVHEAVTEFGVGAEIAATLVDQGFDELDAPVVRVGAAFTPSPFAPVLERAFLPDTATIVAALQKVVARGSA